MTNVLIHHEENYQAEKFRVILFYLSFVLSDICPVVTHTINLPIFCIVGTLLVIFIHKVHLYII